MVDITNLQKKLKQSLKKGKQENESLKHEKPYVRQSVSEIRSLSNT